ncbi:PaaI family thioesterase [Alcanivorax sp. 1008]|uniref:PaaI family thioesterase n=1 Tax=Alcanivorax sp. 1008 TaxID=2816853 RepID=UPI001D34F91D|nr:PaaI family thioesterase [Alcanivorax sp. 1008]MCC1496427.1 PaaI family thioesterase [Alcanivorax sp. 1008]
MSLDARAVEQIISSGVPNFSEHGICVEQAGSGKARLRQPFRQNLIRPGGTLSGPTMMGLADAAMYAAILGQLGRLEMAVTQNLNINFLARPEPCDLIAEAQIIRLGRRSAVLEVRLFSDASEKMVAHVTGIYSLPVTAEEVP